MDKLCLNNPDKLALGNPARLSRIKIIWAKDFFSLSLGSFNTVVFDTGTGNGLAKLSSSLSVWFSFPSSSSKLSSFLTLGFVEGRREGILSSPGKFRFHEKLLKINLTVSCNFTKKKIISQFFSLYI